MQTIVAEVNKLESELINAGKTGRSFFDQVKQRLRDMNSKYIAQYFSFQDIIRYARQAFETIQELDYQLVDLRKTTTMTTTELNSFYNSSANIAKQLGVTSSEIISQAAAWSRLGYSSQEAATQMAQLSSEFATVSPGMTTEQSTDYLVSTMQAYGVAVDDVERKIMDNVNRIGNTFATTNAEIGEMLTRSSAAMKAANNSLEETIALESAAVQITRNAETTGTAFRTVSMRIRGFDEETEEALDDYEELKGKIADLTKTEKTPGGVSLFTDASKTEYKSTYQFLKDISEIWDDLTDKNQAALLEAIGGKRGAQSLAGILSNFSEVERAMSEMEGAAGSAEAEMGIVQESISFKLNALKQEWVETLTQITDRGEIGNVIDGLTKISEGLGFIIDKLGVFKTAIIGVMTVIGSQKLGIFNTNDTSTIFGALNYRGQMKQSRKEAKEYKNILSNLKETSDPEASFFAHDFLELDNYSDNVKNKLHEIQQAAIETGKSGEEAFGEIEIEMEAAEGEATKLGDQLKDIGVSILNGIASAAISAAIAAVVQSVINFIKSDELLAEKTQEIANNFNQQKTQLSEYSGEIIKLQGVLDDSTSTTEEVKSATSDLYKIQRELINQYPAYASQIDVVNGKLEKQLDVLQKINQRNAQDALNEIDATKSDKVRLTNASSYLAASTHPATQMLAFESFMMKFIKNINEGQGIGDSFDSSLFGSDIFGKDYGTKVYGSSSQQIKERVQKYNREFTTDNETVLRLAQNYEDAFKVQNGTIQTVGSIYDVNKAVVELQIQLKELGVTDEEVFNNLSSWAGETSGDIDKFGSQYGTVIEGEILSTRELSENYDDLTEKYNQYLEAQASGDTEAVEKIGQEYVELFDSISKSGIEDQYLDYFKSMYPEMESLISSWQFEVDIIPKLQMKKGLEEDIQRHSADDLKKRYDNWRVNPESGDAVTRGRFKALEESAAEMGYTVYQFIDYMKAIPKYSDSMQHLRDLMGDNFSEDFANKLSESDLTALVNVEPKKDGLKYTQKEIEKLLSPLEVEVEPKINSVDAVKSLNDLESDWSGLETVYQSTVSTAGGVAEAKDIETVNSNMGGIKDAEGNYTAMANALEAYNDALVENKGDSEAAQEATDRLATAYIDQSGILDNLQESNADYYIEMLKARGVTNAEEVVMTRLTKTAKMSAKAMTELSKTIANYRDKLDDGSLFDDALKGDEDAKGAIGDIKSQLKDMLTMYDESGNAIEMPELGTSFIKENLEDIEAAVEGDIDAFDRLRIAAAKVAASQVDIGVSVPTEVAEQNLNKMMEQVIGIDAMDIEVGASVDDGPFVATLTEMIHAGQTTADQVAAAFESMGYTVEWTPHPYTATLIDTLKQHGGNGISSEAIAGMAKAVEVQMDVPELKIKRSSATSGAKTNFGGGNKNGGGGGGSPSGSTSNDSNDIDNDSLEKDASDQFDWIEVKLQRFEEAVKKLDRQVQNTFKNWINRNKKLGDEIAKVTEQIKAQEAAQKSYANHAEKDVKVATPEEPDYKGDLKKQKKAEKEFDKWKKKVRDGKVTDAEILKIKNSFLRDAVFEYKKRYTSGDASVKKTASDVKVKEINIDDYNTQQYAYEKQLSDAAKKIWKSGKYQKLIQEGKIGGKDIEKISNKYLVDAINEYQELWEKSLQAKDTAEELRIQLSELNKQKFDNLTTELEEINGLLEKQSELIDKRIERTELKGFFVDSSYYKDQIKLTEKEIENVQNTLEKHIEALNHQLDLGINNGGVENGSTEWNDMVQQIMEDNNQLEELNNHILELRDNIKQVEWEKFSWLEERLKRINAEADHIIKFLTVNEIYEENGNFKNTGWGNAALVAAQYNNAFAEAERYANEYNEWRTKMNNQTDGASWNNTKDVEHLEELKDGWWSAKEALIDYMQAMKSLVEEAINKHLENLQDVINKYKEALSSAKDLYDFQKNIANQTKQIESLQKQLRAVQGDDSESARKRRQELTNQLESAQQQLQETEWDRYISQTGEMLDDLYEDYEELLNARLDDIIDLMKDMVTEINNNSGNVREGIKVMLQQFGISTDQLEYFESFAKDNNKDLLSAINDGKLVNSNTVMSKTLEEAKGYLDTIADTTTKIGEILSGSKTIRYDSTTGVVSVVDAKSSSNSGGASNGGNGSNAKSGGNNPQDPEAYRQGQIDAAKKSLNTAQEKWHKALEALDKYIAENAKKVKNIKNLKNPTEKQLTWLDKYYRKLDTLERNLQNTEKKRYLAEENLERIRVGYATGTRKVPHDQLAWTQEEGSEVIFRKSDGAMLTPLGQGDMVFTNEMSKTLWAIAKGGIPTNANIIVPDIGGNRNTTVTANNEITITLPNVQDYASFKHDLQNDDNFEKFIQEVTIGQVWGNNKLNKRKY